MTCRILLIPAGICGRLCLLLCIGVRPRPDNFVGDIAVAGTDEHISIDTIRMNLEIIPSLLLVVRYLIKSLLQTMDTVDLFIFVSALLQYAGLPQVRNWNPRVVFAVSIWTLGGRRLRHGYDVCRIGRLVEVKGTQHGSGLVIPGS